MFDVSVTKPMRITPVTRAQAKLAIGKAADAANILDAHLQNQPNDDSAWLLRGQLYQDSGDLQDACDAFARASEIAPASRQARHHLGRALIRLGHIALGEHELAHAEALRAWAH